MSPAASKGSLSFMGMNSQLRRRLNQPGCSSLAWTLAKKSAGAWTRGSESIASK